MEQAKRIGDYEILGKLGSGGMGAVYRVRNVLSDRVEAMKVLLPDLVGRQDLAARFLREIKVLAALDHPNIAGLRTALSADNQLVMIMELVEGESLSRRLADGSLPAGEAVAFVDQTLEALDYAHRQHVIHRDIKPANMMVTPDGVVKLTDFGIARSANDHTLTVVGATTGSLSYMPPEQVQGHRTDPRSDLYSVGVSLYEMVTGRLPFKADSDLGVMLAHLNQDPTPPIELVPALAPELDAIIIKAMAKKPEDRFQSAAELRVALRTVSGVTLAALAGAAPTLHALPAAAVVTVAASAPPPLPAGVAGPAVTVPQSNPVPAPPIPEPAVAARAAVGSWSPVPASAPRRVSPILYVALGAFLVVAAVGGMAYYSRNAEANPAEEQIARQSGSSAPAPPPSSAEPLAAPPAAETETEAPASPPAGATSAPQPAVPQTTAPAVERPLPGAAVRANRSRTPRAQSGEPATTEEAREPPGTPAPAVPAEKDAPQAPDTAALDRLETEIDQLSARAESINGSLDRLKQEQARMGLGLRSDMAARQTSLNLNLSKASDALNGRDVARTQRFRDLAQADLEALEKFFGR